MTIYLEPRHLEIVRKILSGYAADFFIFGSRAKGTHRPLSDLDLLCKVPLTKIQISEIKEKFEESDLPFKIDLVLWDELDENFQQKILPDLMDLKKI